MLKLLAVMWLLTFSWEDCGSGWSCYRFFNTVPAISDEAECKRLGEMFKARRDRDRGKFACDKYEGVQ
jgi:hypothetical protein